MRTQHLTRREFLQVSALAAGGFVLASCSPASGLSPSTPTAAPPLSSATQALVAGLKRGGTLRVHLLAEPKILTPNYVFDAQIFSTTAPNIYNRLILYDGNWKIGPDLAQSWSASEDGKTFTFNLAKDVTWHDGVKFTSADVKWTVESIQQTKGAATASRVANIASMSTPDDNTIIMQLKEVDSAFLANLAHIWSFVILPKHLFENTDPTTNRYYNAPVGTGPFKFTSWQQGSSIAMETNKDYFKGAPFLDKVVTRLIPDWASGLASFEAKELDFITLDKTTEGARLKQNPHIRILPYPIPTLFHLGFNLATKPFSSKPVRQAIAYAIDRDQVSQEAYQGWFPAANYAYLPSIPGAFNPNAKQVSFDPKKAEDLLDQAGYPRGADGVRMTVSLVAPTVQGLNDIATVVQAQLKKIGVETKLDTMDFGAYTEKVLQRKDFQLTVAGGYQGPDPSEMEAYVGTGGFRNPMGYSNSKVDQLFKDARAALTEDSRNRAYWDIQQIILDDLPRLNLVEYAQIFLLWDNYDGLWMEPSAVKLKCAFQEYRGVGLVIS